VEGASVLKPPGFVISLDSFDGLLITFGGFFFFQGLDTFCFSLTASKSEDDFASISNPEHGCVPSFDGHLLVNFSLKHSSVVNSSPSSPPENLSTLPEADDIFLSSAKSSSSSALPPFFPVKFELG